MTPLSLFHAFSSLCTPLLFKKPCHFPFSGRFPSVSSKAHNEGRTIHVLARMVPGKKNPEEILRWLGCYPNLRKPVTTRIYKQIQYILGDPYLEVQDT